ncbi:leucine-rich_repeat domain-containing protein [Hexamita inflata]|uniref:Leucine-rich repeat domain-containing protein n=1 Tax=Hexamita inflata TaxID=28002 RepID=A0AA86NBN0_9EUKA|nr:leucine-rich repeat domain-containing protein [Hexamita inflata]
MYNTQSQQRNNRKQIQKTGGNRDYDLKMTKRFQKIINNGELFINNSRNLYPELKSIEFVQKLNVNRLKLYYCRNIDPKLASDTIKELEIYYCLLNNIENLPLKNLEVLKITESGDTELDISVVDKCTQLKELCLRKKDIEIGPIKQLTTLTKLSLESCCLHNIESLNLLVNLQELLLKGNKGIELGPLRNMNQLQLLNLEECDQLNTTTLKYLINLRKLILNHNPGVDVTPLQNLTFLEVLQLEGCGIKDTSKLVTLVNLVDLNLANNIKLNITSLQYLKKLTHLNIQDCDIHDIYVVGTLVDLVILNVSGNPIVYLYALQKLNGLQELGISYGFIQDYSVKCKSFNVDFNEFHFTEDNQPTQLELKLANKMKIINAQVSFLQQINKRRFNFESSSSITRRQTSKILSVLISNHVKFISSIGQLFGKLCESCQ